MKKKELQPVDKAIAAVFDPTLMLSEVNGNEDIQAEHCAIPFLQIAHGLSEVVKKGKPSYIEGLEPGQIYNTVTKEFFNELTVIPCKIKKSFVAWTDEPKGKPQGEYTEHDNYYQNAKWVENGKGGNVLKAEDGNVLVETYTYLVIYIDPNGKIAQAILPMSKTRLAVAKQWNTKMKSLLIENAEGKKVNPPKCMTMYTLSTIEKSNQHGDWHIYSVDFKGLVDNKDLFEAAQALSGADINFTSEETVEDAVEEAPPIV